MAPRRKPRAHRPTEYEEIARQDGWNDGFDAGYTEGREQAMFDKGKELGWQEAHARLHHEVCRGYDQGYRDAKAGKPAAHRPHPTMGDVTPDMVIDPPEEES